MRISRLVRWNLNNLLALAVVVFVILKYYDYKIARRTRIASHPRAEYGKREFIAVVQAPGTYLRHQHMSFLFRMLPLTARTWLFKQSLAILYV